jgi:hypothetical protein
MNESVAQIIEKAVADARLVASDPATVAHINLLQGIIARLAGASASCKTWCSTLVGALLGLAGAVHVAQFVLAAVIATVLLVYLDILYLIQEIAYRRLYNSIVHSIRTGTYKIENVYVAIASRELSDVGSAIISWSILPFYGALAAAYCYARWSGALDLLIKAKS